MQSCAVMRAPRKACPGRTPVGAPPFRTILNLLPPNPRREQVLETSTLKGFAQNQLLKGNMYDVTTWQKAWLCGVMENFYRKRQNYLSHIGSKWRTKGEQPYLSNHFSCKKITATICTKRWARIGGVIGLPLRTSGFVRPALYPVQNAA